MNRYDLEVYNMYKHVIYNIIDNLDELADEYVARFPRARQINVLIDEYEWGRLVAVFSRKDKKFLKFKIIFDDKYVAYPATK